MPSISKRQLISTHALREEGDGIKDGSLALIHISTHALREEGDVGQGEFGGIGLDFYPRPPRGGRQTFWTKPESFGLFLPTPSARRATKLYGKNLPDEIISTHALREEGDTVNRYLNSGRQHFYPRPPRGGRPQIQR